MEYMHLSSNQFMTYVKKDIQKLLLEKWLHEKSGDEIVIIPPEDVAKNNNIKVFEWDLQSIGKDICWFIKYANDEFSIFIEESHHFNRKRFTLAHELGHYFLHNEVIKTDGIYIDNKESLMFRGLVYSEEEHEANMFAAEYLMPENEVRKLYNKYWVTEILANHFKVSLLAMAYRIDNIFR